MIAWPVPMAARAHGRSFGDVRDGSAQPPLTEISGEPIPTFRARSDIAHTSRGSPSDVGDLNGGYRRDCLDFVLSAPQDVL
jgi:hypothetical protein